MLRSLTAWPAYPIAERHQGRQIRVKACALRSQMQASFAERRAWARGQLAAVLERAGSDVPYYRDLFHELRFDPSRLARDWGYLQELPFLTKDIIREQGARMLSERYSLAELQVRKTGGSTGPSTLVYYSTDALDWTAAANLVCLEWAGKRRHMKETHLSSRFPESYPWKDRLKERLKCLALNRDNILTDSFDEAGLATLWQDLKRRRPYLVQGHPSTLYALALHLRQRGIDGRGAMRVFESTGEVFDAKKRVAIEATFSCQTIDRFGNAEFGVLAYERLNEPERRLKVLDSIAWPEMVGHEGGGQELVFSGLRNDAMPLVRYRTGDLAQMHLADDGYYLQQIVGRVHDVVRIGQRSYPTHYLQDLLDRIGGIDEFQIEQRGNAPLLRLVVPDAQQRVTISRRLEQWWGDAVRLEFTDFDGLARQGWRSKFRYLAESSAGAC